MTTAMWSPGSLVSARGREWIVLTGSTPEALRVRPVSGSEADTTYIAPALELDPVKDARFPPPSPKQRASHDAALLLRDALVLSLRRGAGPFRSFGQIAVAPRAYQLVPLLMALKLETVRLLIADDVGIGKTIEAALIARELLDRGDIERMTVLVPPHLVEQWVTELESRFHIRAVAITAASAKRLESEIPGASLFAAHPHTVVSLDYIKNENRRAEFLRACPEFVIVDEAHTCASAGQGKQGRHQRYDLLKGLCESKDRHVVLLTATPHSGDEVAFYRLLGLLNPEFEKLIEYQGDERQALRERLADHFVQRRRVDIADWDKTNLFPKRETNELTYVLDGPWKAFFDAVLDYCAELVGSATENGTMRVNYWATLALLRCAASSPVAAVLALRTQAGLKDDNAEARDALLERLFDGGDDLPEDDLEPPAATDDPALKDLIEQAERLAGQGGDPKLTALTKHVDKLLAEGFDPVVFCRYIATAHYLGRHLAAHFKDKVQVDIVTGELTSQERKDRVETDNEVTDRRVLVATDCMSEGVNLQHHFDAVVHYDLSWNPTRHEQREGRIDRFGQKQPIVRATLMYGADNPVDGAVLEVILRKATKIREELGVAVPVPDEGHSLTQALLKAVLLKRRGGSDDQERETTGKQLSLLDQRWTDAGRRAKANRTVFAQRKLKPGEVLPELDKTVAAIGNKDDVRRLVDRALARMGSGLEIVKRASRQWYKAPLAALPEEVRERLEAEGLQDTVAVDFDFPVPSRCRYVHRSHPLVSVLAETLLERTLAADVDGSSADPAVLGRIGCWISGSVSSMTVVALLRLRHQLQTQRKGESSTLLVEEATALAWVGGSGALIEGDDALKLLGAAPDGEPIPQVRERFTSQALDLLGSREADLHAYARRRAEALLADHQRVREAAKDRGRYSVTPLLPPDVIGLFVLLPKVS